jgi:hypothetical protein
MAEVVAVVITVAGQGVAKEVGGTRRVPVVPVTQHPQLLIWADLEQLQEERVTPIMQAESARAEPPVQVAMAESCLFGINLLKTP